MAIVAVSQIKPGDRLSDPVLTKRGSLLLEKGRILTGREVEVLHAFFVATVPIESKGGNEAEEEAATAEESATSLPFFEEYNNMIGLLRRVFKLAQSGQPLPVLDIRNRLETLVRLIGQYNVLGISSLQPSPVEYMLHNSVRVSLTAYLLAKWHGFQQKDLLPVALGGLFHDIGNVKVDEAIFEKTSALNAGELEEMRKHTLYGYHLMKNVPAINEGVKLTALQHHEREDGSGYPLAVKGYKIHPYAKVVAIADIFHAMTTNRQHKKAQSPYLVLEELSKEAFGKLDPAMVQTFIGRVTSFHNGTIVKLSDSRIGEIVFSDRANPTRPWVNVKGTIVNLTLERSLHIQEVLNNTVG